MDKKTEKVIERIRRLLALAEDASSPNEALIAAKRARSLMDKHQITKTDVELLGSQFLESKAETATTTRRQWLINLCGASAALNDCEAVISRAPHVEYKFRGFKSDAIVAKMTMDYLALTCERLCKKSVSRGVSGKNFFRLGFSEAVGRRAYEIKRDREPLRTSTGKGLVISKMSAISAHFGSLPSLKERKQREPDWQEVRAYEEGLKAGESVGLDKQVGENKKQQIEAA